MSQPQRIALQTNLSTGQTGLKDVSLITTGIEAAGHGIYLDEVTAETAMKKLLGRSVKSYMKHEGAGGDRLGQEVGFFSGIYRAGQQIKATAFEFLDSFKRDSSAIADKLIEMAAKIPDQFGVSLVLEYRPVWVMGDGTELAARMGEDAPKGAVRPIPSMRVLDVISADWVGMPAANPNGVFSKDSAPVDGAGNSQPTETKNMSETITLSLSDHEAKIAELSAANTATLSVKDGELAALSAKVDEAGKQVAALNAALAAKDTEHKAALEKAVADAVAAGEAKIKELDTFDARKLGVAPVQIRNAQIAKADLSTDDAKLAFYSKLESREEKTAFRHKHRDALIRAEEAKLSAPAK